IGLSGRSRGALEKGEGTQVSYMFLPFKRYFDFQGRSRRLEFWMFFLLNIIVGTIFAIVILVLFAGKLFSLVERYGSQAVESYSVSPTGAGMEYQWVANIPPDVLLRELGPAAAGVMIAYFAYSLLVFIPGLAVTIRRLHDSNRTGWWILLPGLFYAASILLVLVAVTSPGFSIGAGAVAGIFGLLAGVVGLILLVFMFLDGTPGPNQYGPNPKYPHYGGTFA
ncbi:MAG TPA: DUF805 domain-containing protein, partial [Lautropia sp.]|nr:DUF805 domain-containing protein [Lautropia sp.]